MKTVYLILLVALVGWKGYYAWLRGRKQWLQDQQQYQTLCEYLLGNGETCRQLRHLFLKRAVVRALKPLQKQWRLWAVVVAVGILIWIV